MSKRTGANNNRATTPTEPLLTIDRAIAEGLCPTSLRQVAAYNERKGGRRERQAANLHRVADKLELLGYGRKEAA